MKTKTRLQGLLLLLLMLLGTHRGMSQHFRVVEGVPHLPVVANTAEAVTLFSDPLVTGLMVFCTDDKRIMLYDGSSWHSFCGVAASVTSGSGYFQVKNGFPVAAVGDMSAAGGTVGETYYSNVEKAFMVYDGTSWSRLEDLPQQASLPTSSAGVNIYKSGLFSFPVLDTAPIAANLLAGAIYIDAASGSFQLYDSADWLALNCDCPPIADGLLVTADAASDALWAGYVYSDRESSAEGASIFRWFGANDASGAGATEIGGATTSTCIADYGTYSYYAFEVTPVASTGSPLGDAVLSAYFNASPLATVVVANFDGTDFTGSYTYSDNEGDANASTFQWYGADDALGTNKTEIAGATGLTYTADDTYAYYAFEVSPKASAGTLVGRSVCTVFIEYFYCGGTFEVSHTTTGGVAPVNKVVVYGTVLQKTGATTADERKCWITRNLGASQQATSAADATDASAGWYWQFNRKQGYQMDGTTRTPGTAWITSIDESSDWLSANDPCVLDLGNGWRLPTKSEWAFIDNAEGWVNYNDTYDSVLKLHAAGNLNYSVGSLNSRGIYGYYWSSTQFSSTNGRYFILNSGSAYTNSSFKTNGFAVRCLRDY